MRAAELGNASRFAARPLDSGGTPIDDWLANPPELPTLDTSECPGLILVAPHPDDETLGFGSTAAMLRARGVGVQVVSVSDGGRGYPGLSPLERTWLERDRRAEVALAARELGLPPPIHLGLPDGELGAQEATLTALLTDLLESDARGSWCAATWSGDGHPDHEAVGRAAIAASAAVGRVLLEYPVWMWHWAHPGDPGVPWHRLFAMPTDGAAHECKRRAIEAHASQVAGWEPGVDPALPAFAVRRLLSVGEVAFR